MKNIKHKILFGCLVAFQLNSFDGISQNQPIQLNTTPVTSSCNIGNLGTVTISAPTEVLSGDNIPLNITLPGTLDQSCTKTVTITPTSNLQFVNSGSIPFVLSGGSYTNAAILPGNDGQNFNVFFKFPGGITCNNEEGTFLVTVTAICNGVETSCTSSVTVKARAANYWSITKEYIAGNMVCGTSQWKFWVKHTNPNGQGLGAYNINGTITESPSLTVVSGATHNVNQSYLNFGWASYYSVLQNCYPTGSTITNSAAYNFNLGNGCETMSGTVTATSPPLVSPNASVQFTKRAYDNNNFPNTQTSFNPTQGCEGRYVIQIYNNGNVCLTDIEVADNLSIPGISVTNIALPGGWTNTPLSPPFSGIHTFSSPAGFILNPNQSAYINIYYTVTGPTSTIISNTANLSYQTINCTPPPDPNLPPVDPCPGINCPVISDTIQNTSTTVDFTVKAKKANPLLKKGILSPPNNATPPIYQIGSTIKFRIQVGNSGSDLLNTVVSDVLGVPSQNLEIIPSTIDIKYYPNENLNNYIFIPTGTGVYPPPFSVAPDVPLNPQNPSWTITGMPGICLNDKANYLFIEFEATIKPQISGSKTNTASLTNGTQNLSSSVNYTIDQIGILGIHKEADKQFVENGQGYNYIITVTNNGSVPLNNVVVTDNLPDCSPLNGAISIKKGSTAISFTGNLSSGLNIIPTSSILPGESFVITVPVVKSGSGTCCNETVSATALMTNSQQLLSANFGNQNEPAACVSSVSCCDIPELSVTLKPMFSGGFNLNINAGTTPIQNIEVSMADYHVAYENDLCKPANMGIFGNIYSPNNTVGGLVLADNGTQSISWNPGSPSVFNGNIKLNISKPNILNLPCCNGVMYFCLKVKVTDVNCNVCEKFVCGSINLNPKKLTPLPSDTKPLFKKNLKIRPELKNQYEKMKSEEPMIEFYQLEENKEEIKENNSKN